MSMVLNLTPDIEQRLIQEAERQGVSADAYALQLLDSHLPSQERRAELVALLQSWIEGSDVKEQKETGDYLIRVLDEDRLDRKSVV